MSQPGNYRYQSHDQTGSLKSGIPLMVNGQPNTMQHTQNGTQPAGFNSAGTPSSQSSRDPSRETSRDPSPTRYIHNQYRPQLSRPPMPPLNGQQSPQSHLPMSQQPNSVQFPQSSPLANSQNMSNQFTNVQTSSPVVFSPQTKQRTCLSAAQSLSSDSQIGGASQTQKSTTPTRYDFPNPNRSIPATPGFQTVADSQVGPSHVSQSGQLSEGQNLPFAPSDRSVIQSQSLNPQAYWNKDQASSISKTMNQTSDTTRSHGRWRSPNVESNSNNFQTTSQPYSTQSTIQSQANSIAPAGWSKEGTSSSVTNSTNPSISTFSSPNQTSCRNPGVDSNSNDSQGASILYTGLLHQSPDARPRPQPSPDQKPGFVQPSVNSTTGPGATYLQDSLGNKANLTHANVNLPGPQAIGAQASPTMPGMGTNMRNVFGNTSSNQHPGLKDQGSNQSISSPPIAQHSSLPKPQAQYPTPHYQTNMSIPVANQSNQSAYGSQQNVASQWKYSQSRDSAQSSTVGPSISGPYLGATNATGVPPMLPGQVPHGPPGQVPLGPPGQVPLGPSGQVPLGSPGQVQLGPSGQVPLGPSGQVSLGLSGQVPHGPLRQVPLGLPGQVPLGPSGQVPLGPPGQVPLGPPRASIAPPPLPGQQPEAPYDNRASYFGHMSNVPLDNMNKRYPTTAYPEQMNQLNTQMGNLNVTQSGFNELWGQQSIDLLQCRNVLPGEKVEPPRIKLHQEFLDSVNCSPDIFRCTLTKIPESNSLLQKCRLPLGVLIHPFKDLNHLPVIQCSTIVRCRACRTYINPFVYFVDSKRWKCNLCYRVNELPEEFQFDPVTKSYGDPSRRPEVKTSTIEFIAPSEYMLRPPQPAVYLFILDVSRLAVDSGYLGVACETIADELTKLPGDGRTQVGFMAIDSAVHFFSMPENVSQPHELIMLDVDDVFLPCPDNLVVNLKERAELVRDLLEQLPVKFNGTHDTNSALGAGLQAAFKLMSPTGGRVTVFQTCLPNLGPGALQAREDPNTRASKDVPHLNPATDFYKRLALDCSGQQIAVDLFLLNSQYSDLATLSGMCKFSGGCIYHIPLFRRNKPQHSEILERMLRRYLTRKIGFEAVMRIRCTRGLSIHTFHGNFFVRSTDLLSLPNVNPDAGFGMQVSIEESLSDVQSICFQAALLYTSSKGERRIRVHTLCLPVSASMTDILYSADQQAIIGLLSKMAVDRAQQSSLSDARDALINVAIDVLSSYKLSQSSSTGGLMAPENLKLLPLYIIALMKSMSFRSGTSTRLDDRVYAMCQMKALPLGQLMQITYPDLYPVHALDDRNSKDIDGKVCPLSPRLHLSAEKLDFRGVFLMDAGDRIYIYVGKSVDPIFCCNVLGVPSYESIPEEFYDLPELETVESERLRNFVFSLQEEKPYYASLQIIRDDSHFRSLFTDRLIEDRFENALSYYEFLQHLKTQVK